MLALLASCSGPRPAVPPTPTPSPPNVTASAPAPVPAAAPPAAPTQRATLASEQVRLAELFRGTPVVFTLQQDGSLRVTVPRRHSFDIGTARIKPPLAAVLDRLAKSQSRTNARFRLAAPADPDARMPTLARDRAASLRDHLMARGVAAARLQTGSVVPTDQVELMVTEASR